MIFRQSNHKAVCVIVPSKDDLARYYTFEHSLEGLEAPVGSFVNKVRGSSSLALGVNIVIREVIARADLRDVGSFFFMDDDHECEAGALLGLLESVTEKVRIVQALCMRKELPFDLMAFTDARKIQYPKWQFDHLKLSEVAGQHGPRPVKYVGRGGLLVMRDVFEHVSPPWFKVGQFDPEEFQEDMYFSEKAREAGFQPHVHLDVHTGHTAPIAVWPHRLQDGRVVPRLQWSDGKVIVLSGWKQQ